MNGHRVPSETVLPDKTSHDVPNVYMRSLHTTSGVHRPRYHAHTRFFSSYATAVLFQWTATRDSGFLRVMQIQYDAGA